MPQSIQSQAAQYPGRVAYVRRQAAIPDDPDAQWYADVLRAIYQNAIKGDPGVTVGLTTEDAPRSGTMVSLPGSEVKAPTLPSAQALRDFVDRYREELSDSENYLGGWEHPRATDPVPEDADEEDKKPKWYLDVSRNYDDPWEAALAALSGDQIGVYTYEDPWGEGGEYVDTPKFVHDQIAKGGSRIG